MLQAIRDKARGWIAWVIVILISIPFALWGIQEYFGVGGTPVVATVNGEEITERDLEQRVFARREQLRRALGENYQHDLFDDASLRDEALNGLVEEALFLQAADQWRLRATVEQIREHIRSQPVFQVDGRFDNARYQAVLRNNGMSELGYEASVEQDLVKAQFLSAIRDSALVTTSEAREAARLAGQLREIAYAVVPADKYAADVEPDESALQTYHETNRAEYVQPERVKLAYVELSIDALAQKVTVPDAAIEDFFAARVNEFRAPEQRRARHILIEVGDDEAAAMALARDLRARILGGETFDAVAREASADPGSAAKGGDLGWVEPGMDPAFDAVVTSLEQGQISEPVKTAFGIHLIEVTEVRAGGDTTLDRVRPEVEQAYRDAQAEEVFYDLSEPFADLAYEQPDSLDALQQELGLEIAQSDWITSSGGEGVLGDPKVRAVAFSEDLVQRRHNSDVIELGPNHLVVLRVVEHEAERLLDLDTVREAVVADYRRHKAAELAEQNGRKLLDAVKADGLDTVADREGIEVARAADIKRDNFELPAEVVQEAFRLPRPGDADASYSGLPLANGDFALIAVTRVADPEADSLNEEIEQLRAGLAGSRAGDTIAKIIATLRTQAEVQLNR